MTSKFTVQNGMPSEKPVTAITVLLTPKEAAQRLKLSTSWLAKGRMRGDGPPFVQVGRAIRYTEGALLQWVKRHTRTSTSQP
jgi:predicted DNA-binding transcriptional regulator AlpA